MKVANADDARLHRDHANGRAAHLDPRQPREVLAAADPAGPARAADRRARLRHRACRRRRTDAGHGRASGRVRRRRAGVRPILQPDARLGRSRNDPEHRHERREMRGTGRNPRHCGGRGAVCRVHPRLCGGRAAPGRRRLRGAADPAPGQAASRGRDGGTVPPIPGRAIGRGAARHGAGLERHHGPAPAPGAGGAGRRGARPRGAAHGPRHRPGRVGIGRRAVRRCRQRPGADRRALPAAGAGARGPERGRRAIHRIRPARPRARGSRPRHGRRAARGRRPDAHPPARGNADRIHADGRPAVDPGRGARAALGPRRGGGRRRPGRRRRDRPRRGPDPRRALHPQPGAAPPGSTGGAARRPDPRHRGGAWGGHGQDRVFRRRRPGRGRPGRGVHPGAPRNQPRGHSRDARRPGHPDRTRWHDQPRGRDRARPGPALRQRRDAVAAGPAQEDPDGGRPQGVSRRRRDHRRRLDRRCPGRRGRDDRTRPGRGLRHADGLGRRRPRHRHSRQCRHRRGRRDGAALRRRRHRAVPHRTHVLRSRAPDRDARDDLHRKSRRPGRRPGSPAADAARGFRGPVQADAGAAGLHSPVRPAAARIPARRTRRRPRPGRGWTCRSAGWRRESRAWRNSTPCWGCAACASA